MIIIIFYDKFDLALKIYIDFYKSSIY